MRSSCGWVRKLCQKQTPSNSARTSGSRLYEPRVRLSSQLPENESDGDRAMVKRQLGRKELKNQLEKTKRQVMPKGNVEVLEVAKVERFEFGVYQAPSKYRWRADEPAVRLRWTWILEIWALCIKASYRSGTRTRRNDNHDQPLPCVLHQVHGKDRYHGSQFKKCETATTTVR